MRHTIAKLSIGLLLTGAFMAVSVAQTAKDDMKQAGKNVKEAGKDVGKAGENTGKATAKTAKKAAKKVKHGTNKAAGKVEEKTRDKQ
jgi:hypothetical protein